MTVEEAGLGEAGPAAGPRPGPAAAPAAGGLHRLAVHTLADADPRSRPRLLNGPYRPGPVPVWSPEPAADAPPGTELSRLAARRHLAGHAERLRALVHSFAGLYLAHGGSHSRAALAAWLSQDAGAFAARPGQGPDGREVLPGYAQLAHLLGDMTADAGHHGLAQEYHTIALGLARQAGDRRMYAITLRAMSAHAGRLGQPAHAARLAALAVDTVPEDGDPAVRAFLLAQRAAARAHAGERAAALADLATADALRAGAPRRPGPFDSYGRADLDYARARTHLALGEYPAAADALERSLRARPPGHHRPTALTHALLAETVLRLGHLTQACEHWRAFLTALPAVHSRAVREALGRLLRDLTPYRHVREVVPTLAMARAFAERL